MLIVDDDNPLQGDLIDFLKKYRIDFLFASTPKEAIQILNQENFDFLMVATLTPHKETVQMLEYLKANQNSRAVPIIVMSNYYKSPSFNEIIEKMQRTKYLVRPFLNQELFETIEFLYTKTNHGLVESNFQPAQLN